MELFELFVSVIGTGPLVEGAYLREKTRRAGGPLGHGGDAGAAPGLCAGAHGHRPHAARVQGVRHAAGSGPKYGTTAPAEERVSAGSAQDGVREK
jgi:hypothetical protein